MTKEQGTYQSDPWYQREKWAIRGQYVKLGWEGMDYTDFSLLVGARGQNMEVFWAL